MAFATQAEAKQFIKANGIKYDNGRGRKGFHMIKGYRVNGVTEYRVELISRPEENVPEFKERSADVVKGATRKMSLTDRAVQALIKGQDRAQIIATLIAAGATSESARCTAHFVVTGKVSKAHAAMIEAGKWIGYNAR